MNTQPYVSIIIPTYNGEKRLPNCLESIKKQTYPQDKIEIIIVDDDSTDNTVRLAKEKYKCAVYRNGTHNPQRGKSIGIEHANGEYLFFIDDDNCLIKDSMLQRLVEAVVTEKANGGQVAWFEYEKEASVIDRYSSLFGCPNPAVYYLGKRDHMQWTEKAWKLGGEVQRETQDYYKIRFSEKNLPTIGSQGFLIKTELVKKIHWTPYFYHIDFNVELIRLGFDKYIILKESVIHRHGESVKKMFEKIKRNTRRWGTEDKYRCYSYNLTMPKMIKLGLTMGTFIIPLKDSIIGFVKFPSSIWFLHPIVSFYTACIYTWYALKKKDGWKSIK